MYVCMYSILNVCMYVYFYYIPVLHLPYTSYIHTYIPPFIKGYIYNIYYTHTYTHTYVHTEADSELSPDMIVLQGTDGNGNGNGNGNGMNGRPPPPPPRPTNTLLPPALPHIHTSSSLIRESIGQVNHPMRDTPRNGDVKTFLNVDKVNGSSSISLEDRLQLVDNWNSNSGINNSTTSSGDRSGDGNAAVGRGDSEARKNRATTDIEELDSFGRGHTTYIHTYILHTYINDIIHSVLHTYYVYTVYTKTNGLEYIHT